MSYGDRNGLIAPFGVLALYSAGIGTSKMSSRATLERVLNYPSPEPKFSQSHL